MSDAAWLDEYLVEDNTTANGLPAEWTVERFKKRHTRHTPGQCDQDCDCGCPYKEMSELEALPLIATITKHFPNEWLAFVVPPEEDDDPLPVHGKLVAHSPSLDEVHDAILTVLWNQCVYVFYNGDLESQQASLGNFGT